MLQSSDLSVRGVSLTRAALAALAFLVLGGIISAQPGAASLPPSQAPTTGGGCGWVVHASPNVNQYNTLHAAAAFAPDNLWAVGSRGDGFTGQFTLTMRWDGTQWSIVPSPSPGAGMVNELNDLVAFAPDNLWAIGYYNNPATTGSDTFVIRWDGAAWTQVPSPNVGNVENQLLGADGIAPNDIWAVGYSWNTGARNRTLALRWDGGEWRAVPTLNVGVQDNRLHDIDALAADDAWAVGYYINSGGTAETLTQRWNGAAWSTVASPNVSGVNTYLDAVTMVAPDDVWAVGRSCPANCFGGNIEHLFIVHWDGTQWTRVTARDPGTHGSALYDVYAVSTGEVWAVGYYSTGTEGRTLTLRWDGTQWSVVENPTINSCCPQLNAITDVPGGGMWAVGHFHFSGNPVFRTLTERYGGPCGATPTPTAASTQAPPTATPVPPTLTPIATTPPATATAQNPTPLASPTIGAPCGYLPQSATSQCEVSTTYHYTFNWYVESGCGPRSGSATVTLQVAESASGPWVNFRTQAVQVNMPGGPGFGSVMGAVYAPDVPWNYTHYRVTISGILGGAPLNHMTPPDRTCFPPFSPTPTVSTTATPTACTQSFTDVQPTDTFYPFIRCLACRGIIGGYADGTFRPNNNITRGQIAKMVSNAAGFSEPITGQSFEDVPPASPFYEFIERLYRRGHMGGYPCGQRSTETCIAPENRPYFRPNEDATRGQLSKIVSNAAGYNEPHTGQFYADITQDNPFYPEIMRLTSRSVMSGYPCGGEGEPCDPQNRPYFRWGNPVTRGQASKIVANTFFPGCAAR
jgi:hypothetical protein